MRGVAQEYITFTTRGNDYFCLYIIQKKIARKKNNGFAFHPHITSWVHSTEAVPLALFECILDEGRDHDRSALEKIHTAPLDNTKNFYTAHV